MRPWGLLLIFLIVVGCSFVGSDFSTDDDQLIVSGVTKSRTGEVKSFLQVTLHTDQANPLERKAGFSDADGNYSLSLDETTLHGDLNLFEREADVQYLLSATFPDNSVVTKQVTWERKSKHLGIQKLNVNLIQ